MPYLFITPYSHAPRKTKSKNKKIKGNNKILKEILPSKSLKIKKGHLSMPPLRASFTIEAAVVLPIFLTLMIYGIFLMRILEVQSGVQRAIDEASRSMAVGCTSEDESGAVGLMASTIAYANVLIKTDNVPTSYVNGGMAGIDYSESSADGNYIDLKVNYKIKFPIGLLGKFTFSITQESRNRKWIGYDPSEGTDGNTYVYITTYGTVYHTDYNCTYLNPSVRQLRRLESTV